MSLPSKTTVMGSIPSFSGAVIFHRWSREYKPSFGFAAEAATMDTRLA
jgi:hypothetical protein